MADAESRRALIAGASRGLGLGLARELLSRGWHVIATVRDAARPTPLHDLTDSYGDRLVIETLDITEPDQIEALRARWADQPLDLLFVNAGVANGPGETIDRTTADEFTRILTTNTLSPMRVIERFHDAVRTDGVIGVMSSGLGSVANNTTGGWEVYRASKAGLNTLMCSFAARHAGAPWSLAVIAPGWVRTEMGGPDATLDVETSMRGVADVLEGRRGTRGVAYLNYLGETVPW